MSKIVSFNCENELKMFSHKTFVITITKLPRQAKNKKKVGNDKNWVFQQHKFSFRMSIFFITSKSLHAMTDAVLLYCANSLLLFYCWRIFFFIAGCTIKHSRANNDDDRVRAASEDERKMNWMRRNEAKWNVLIRNFRPGMAEMVHKHLDIIFHSPLVEEKAAVRRRRRKMTRKYF